MTLSRRNFIKKACLSSACICGFNTISGVNSTNNTEALDDDRSTAMFQKWISEILTNLDDSLPETEIRKLVKSASLAHYQNLNMDTSLAPYIGKMNDFIRFIEKEWGWIFSYEDNGKVILADENKSACVCPLINKSEGIKYPALCFCSEGFAEMMFSKVNESPVKATVISSIQRGNEKCVYRITLNK
ncbi:hypothetical protein [uncultured Dysgonomonas sp.]|uniref:Uncharacterized protein n=1 Tax=uncultured Dysgonomonas sp. TaxID=206096 RepID=A0A212K475_9BACT|nr:hypothetical protein [uncultured Dysgonomonas sp.]SBW06417.1 conserved exported hypothetical protein [uncultured Dysgonomonas sp.]